LLTTPNQERDCFLTRPEVAIRTIAGFSTGSGSVSHALLYHAPMRIKGFMGLLTLRERVAERRGLRDLEAEQPGCFLLRPLSATADPENDRFQAVSKDKRQLSWFAGASISMAHGVVSKDGNLGLIGVERVSNQLGWFGQHKFGFPVPAHNLREHFLLLV
jgi:hypothetical protein